MKKSFLILGSIIAVITVAVGVCTLISYRYTQDSSSQRNTHASAFNIQFKYGVGAKNILDSFHNTFTKDMILDRSITIPLTLSDDELTHIQQRITELDVFYSRSTDAGGTWTITQPCSSYDLFVQANDIQHHIVWDCEKRGSDFALETLADEIRGIIESKDVYKKLPESQGGYL